MAQTKEIKLTEIATSPLNPRKTFDEVAIKELAQSIEQNGLIQAITLRKKKGENGEKYEIVCGECRYRAHVLLGRETIEAVVKDLDDKQAFACMVIENLHRKDIDPMEEASALKYLYSEAKVPVKEIAKMLGKSGSFVTNRIQLNNIVSDFVELMRDGTLNLNHLLEISKLTHDQQRVLMESCFQPANIERWTFKTLKLEMLKEWIDEHVMGTLSAARFDFADDTFSTCKACKDCKFNTARYPNRFKDTDNPRCMKVELFRAKNQEAVLRQAKELGLPMVYIGTPDENKGIVAAAQEMLLYPQPRGTREYLVEPVAPSEDSFTDPERYKKRLANYERVRGVFDENIEAGLVIKVLKSPTRAYLLAKSSISITYKLTITETLLRKMTSKFISCRKSKWSCARLTSKSRLNELSVNVLSWSQPHTPSERARSTQPKRAFSLLCLQADSLPISARLSVWTQTLRLGQKLYSRSWPTKRRW